MLAQRLTTALEKLNNGGVFRMTPEERYLVHQYRQQIDRPSWRGPPDYPPAVPLPKSPYRSRYTDLSHDEFWALPSRVRTKYFAGPSMLEDLPLELLSMILDFAMAHLPSVLIITASMRAKQFFYPKILPGLCFVNRFFFEEGLVAYLRHREVELACTTEGDNGEDKWTIFGPMASFVSAIDATAGRKGWLWIRDLTIAKAMTNWSSLPQQYAMVPNSFSGVALRAPMLRKLTVNFDSSLFLKFNESTFAFEAVPVEKSLQMLNLQTIFWLASLRVLVVRVGTPRGLTEKALFEVHGIRLENYIHPLLIWLSEGFLEWGRRVEIAVDIVHGTA